MTRLADIGGCWSPSFSPDGLRLAFVSNQGGVPQVWVVATDGVRPEQVTRLEDQVSQVEWSPDGRWLAFTLAPGGGMNSQVYLMRPDGQQLSRTTEGGQVNNRLTGFSHDGRLMLLNGDAIVLAGATGRVGGATLATFVNEGARVLLLSRSLERARTVINDILDDDEQAAAIPFAADVTDPAQASAAWPRV